MNFKKILKNILKNIPIMWLESLICIQHVRTVFIPVLNELQQKNEDYKGHINPEKKPQSGLKVTPQF